MKMTYAEQLQHPKWQERRLRALDRAGFKCESCEDKDTMLHVHHKRYVKGRMAWEYEDEELQVLCKNCHKYVTDARALIDELLAAELVNLEDLGFMLAGYLQGMAREPKYEKICSMAEEVDVRTFFAGLLAQQIVECCSPSQAGEIAAIMLRESPQNAASTATYQRVIAIGENWKAWKAANT